MSSRIFGPKTVTFELPASEASCKKCIEEGLRTQVLQYQISYVKKRDSYVIITTGDPEQLKAGILKHIAEEEANCPEPQSQPKEARRQKPQAQPRTRRESSPLPLPPPPPPPAPQPSAAPKK
ncbi:hypothetical protein NCS55_01400000 [Fusarium keratoplasticum]|nr:hypothetical protein NCS55_01400000 [Fusarium keratoplasticum]